MTSERRNQALPRIPELEEDYELIRELGRGGTAVVYLARERELGRLVAIKLIRPTYVQDDDAVARLVREARTVGQLQHPNIVMLLGARRLGERELALILQFVPGTTLKAHIREKGALPFETVTRILGEMGRALEYAHRHRIVHRDIKPENVYLDEQSGVARIADFGIARVWDSESGLTLPGTALGTPAYMSPEQVDGRDLDGRSDLFSLGLVGYEMLTGEAPWAGESLYSVIYKQKHEELPPLAKERPGVPDPLRVAIEGALRKDPTERWPDAAAFLAALEGRVSSPAEARAASGAGGEAAASPTESTPPSGSPPGPADQPAASGSGAPSRPGMEDRMTVRYRPPDADEGPVAREPPVSPAASYDPGGPGGEARSPLPQWMRALEGRSSGRRRGEAAAPVPVPPPEPGVAPFDWVEEELEAAEVREAQAARRRRDLTAKVVVALGLVLLIGGGGLLMSSEPDGAVRSLAAYVFPFLGGGADDGEPDAGVASLERGAFDDPAADPELASGAAPPDPEDSPAAGEPARVVVVGGQVRAGEPGLPLAGPVILRVVDDEGVAVPGVEVVFEVASGGGSVNPARIATSSEGTASTAWTLGPSEGPQRLRATVPSNGLTTEVTAGATTEVAAAAPEADERPGAAGIELLRGGDQVAAPGTSLPVPLEVRVADGGGAPMADVPVQFVVMSGGGSVGPEVSDTDAGGIARAAWTLGPNPGTQEVRAYVRGARSLEVSFTARAEGADPAPTPVEAAPVPGPTEATRLGVRAGVAPGGTYSCSLRPDGSLVCWGGNDGGQLGDGTRNRRLAPGPGVQGGPYAVLAAGVSHACAIQTDGRLFCWGANAQGQLGDGSGAAQTTPVAVAFEGTFVDVTAGASHTCALTSGGEAYCWGANDQGQLGDGSTSRRMSPVRVQAPAPFRRIVAGWRHTCAFDAAGTAYCWGANDRGQVGVTGAGGAVVPRPVAGGHRFQDLAAGNAHTCGLSGQGQVLCWGSNESGQLGAGAGGNRSTPAPVSGSASFVEVVSGGVHACALTSNGAVRCWGGNGYGQLGDGSTENRSAPVEVAGNVRFAQVGAIGSHTCGRTPGGEVYCWGYNVEGQLGDGTRENRAAPTPVTSSRP